MGKESRIRIESVAREEPNIGLYVQALVALARQLQAAEAEKARTETDRSAPTTPPAGGTSSC
jgi:hypothetical protein